MAPRLQSTLQCNNWETAISGKVKLQQTEPSASIQPEKPRDRWPGGAQICGKVFAEKTSQTAPPPSAGLLPSGGKTRWEGQFAVLVFTRVNVAKYLEQS